MASIDYFFALNSPWSFMGSERLAQIAATRKAKVNVHPVKLGAVFDKTGGLPLPKRAPERQAYRLMELARWSKWLGIPLVIKPKNFPYDEAEAARLVMAAQKSGKDALKLATEIGRALWERDENPADAVVLDAAAKRAALDADALRKSLSAEEAGKQWEQNTQTAISRNVFGAPSYVVGDEVFWGQDRLDFVDRALA
ncbi:MAG: 2-hydroxychromene-2-carboxylate isomerase [Pseudomonadota bacterium]|nr:2-hydroxychromene-2-carboxylate isomerase [Pseudomonadota bacterium]